jgi:hypothetical protein
MNIIFYWKKEYFEKEYTTRGMKFYSKYPPDNGLSQSDTMWVIAKNINDYVLVGKFFVLQTIKELHPQHGDFCIVADNSQSEYYRLDSQNQKSFKDFIKNLLQLKNDEIGLYFEGDKHICELTSFQNQEFEKYSKSL